MYLIGNRRCPNCGVKGKAWKKGLGVFRCPSCNLIFNDFGIVHDPSGKKEGMFS